AILRDENKAVNELLRLSAVHNKPFENPEEKTMFVKLRQRLKEIANNEQEDKLKKGRALYVLGSMKKIYGRSAKNDTKTSDLYKQSAAQGYDIALYKLGEFYGNRYHP